MLMMGAADVLVWIQTIANGGVLIAQLVQMGSMLYLMNQITNGAWLLKQARKFCIEFDQIMVKYSEQIYGYFTDIVGGTLITPKIIDDLLSRVYIIVGIFIFFKIMMVAIKYMMNPQEFTDDKMGAQTLVKRVIIGSLVIIMIPLIFDKANDLQAAIIKDRVIEKIILPEDAYKKLIKTGSPGKDLSMMVFNGFFDWNDSVNKEKARTVYKNYEKVKAWNDLTLFNKDNINETVDDKYAINYIPIISTLAVGYLLFTLIKYAMEVAFRSFKLMFLQVISPFVIVNYMLDTSKEEVMKKWLNTTISTYILIFIRVMTLWLAVLICYYLNNGVSGTSLLNTDDPLLKSLIILALFAFLKELPKLISEIFGYNLQENETINGLMNQGVGIIKGFAMAGIARDLTKTSTYAGMAGSGLGAVGSGAGAGLSAGNQAKKNGLGKVSQGASIVGGSFTGLSSGFSSVSSMAGSVTSSSMGQTFLSPIAQTASAASHSAPIDPRTQAILDKDALPEKPDEKDVKVANNIANNQAFAQYKYGDNFDLSAPGYDENGQEIPNPMVTQMAEAVFDSLPDGSISSDKDTAMRIISNKINNTLSHEHMISNCSTENMARVMTKVEADIVASSPSPTHVIDNNPTVSDTVIAETPSLTSSSPIYQGEPYVDLYGQEIYRDTIDNSPVSTPRNDAGSSNHTGRSEDISRGLESIIRERDKGE